MLPLALDRACLRLITTISLPVAPVRLNSLLADSHSLPLDEAEASRHISPSHQLHSRILSLPPAHLLLSLPVEIVLHPPNIYSSSTSFPTTTSVLHPSRIARPLLCGCWTIRSAALPRNRSQLCSLRSQPSTHVEYIQAFRLPVFRLKLAPLNRFSPPSLSSTRSPSVEDTPINTPSISIARPTSAKERPQQDLFYGFRGRHATDDDLNHDDILFPDDEQDSVFPLFASDVDAMVGPASPIDIATSRQASSSPRTQQSNLTSQLQQPQIDVHTPTTVNTPDEPAPERNRQESIGMLGTTPYGARQIPMGNGQRRESYGMSGSLMTGMSWGGISMGSFIRDE